MKGREKEREIRRISHTTQQNTKEKRFNANSNGKRIAAAAETATATNDLSIVVNAKRERD